MPRAPHPVAVPVAVVVLAGCGAACGGPMDAASPSPPARGLELHVEARVPDVATEAIVVTVDGATQPGHEARFGTLAAGEHTIQVRFDGSFPCGLLDEPRGRMVVTAARTFLADDPQASLSLVFEGRSSTYDLEDRVAARWTLPAPGRRRRARSRGEAHRL